MSSTKRRVSIFSNPPKIYKAGKFLFATFDLNHLSLPDEKIIQTLQIAVTDKKDAIEKLKTFGRYVRTYANWLLTFGYATNIEWIREELKKVLEQPTNTAVISHPQKPNLVILLRRNQQDLAGLVPPIDITKSLTIFLEKRKTILNLLISIEKVVRENLDIPSINDFLSQMHFTTMIVLLQTYVDSMYSAPFLQPLKLQQTLAYYPDLKKNVRPLTPEEIRQTLDQMLIEEWENDPRLQKKIIEAINSKHLRREVSIPYKKPYVRLLIAVIAKIIDDYRTQANGIVNLLRIYLEPEDRSPMVKTQNNIRILSIGKKYIKQSCKLSESQFKNLFIARKSGGKILSSALEELAKEIFKIRDIYEKQEIIKWSRLVWGVEFRTLPMTNDITYHFIDISVHPIFSAKSPYLRDNVSSLVRLFQLAHPSELPNVLALRDYLLSYSGTKTFTLNNLIKGLGLWKTYQKWRHQQRAIEKLKRYLQYLLENGDILAFDIDDKHVTITRLNTHPY